MLPQKNTMVAKTGKFPFISPHGERNKKKILCQSVLSVGHFCFSQITLINTDFSTVRCLNHRYQSFFKDLSTHRTWNEKQKMLGSKTWWEKKFKNTKTLKFYQSTQVSSLFLLIFMYFRAYSPEYSIKTLKLDLINHFFWLNTCFALHPVFGANQKICCTLFIPYSFSWLCLFHHSNSSSASRTVSCRTL